MADSTGQAQPSNVARLKAGDRVPGYKFGQACYVPTEDIQDDEQLHNTLPTAPISFTRHKASGRDSMDAPREKNITNVEIASPRGDAPTADSETPSRALLGLFQENEKWGKESSQDDSETIIMTGRMRLAKGMDSIYVNLLVIIVVLIDVGSIIYFEAYQDPAEKDCFNRDHPIQAQITIFALSCFALELLLRMVGRGPRAFFACRLSNFWNWFDIVIVGSSIILAIFKIQDDASHRISCGEDDLCPPDSWDVGTNYSSTAVGCDNNWCPWIPQSPYAEVDDAVIDEALWLCNQEGVNSAQKVAGSAVSSTRVVSRVIVGLRIIRAITGVNRVRRAGSHVRNLIRARASKGTRRYKMLGFDLDLCYITTRCIAMAAPSKHQLYSREEDGEVFGLNDANMVARLLAIRHYDKFRVYNLCEESLGDYAPTLLFSQVHRIPVQDRHPPMLKDVLIFCDNVARYLLSDSRAVVVLHCSSGTGRSGVMAACWLLYSGHRVWAKDALELFASRRSGKKSEDGSYQHSVRGPSEQRAVSYIEAVLYNNVSFSASERIIHSVSFSSVEDSIWMSVRVICQNKIIYDSSDKSNELTLISAQNSTIKLPHVLCFGDTELVFYRHKKSNRRDRKKQFYACFHTAFYSSDQDIDFAIDEIDWVGKDVVKTYAATFGFRVHFEPNDASHPLVVPFRTFRELITARGIKKTFHRGETIIDAGSRSRRLYLVVQGNVSQVVEESWGLGATDTETTTVSLLSEGDVFGAGAFCLGLPETRHICASQQVTVVMLTLPDTASAQDVGSLEVPGYPPHQLPELFKTLAQLLCWEYSRNFKVSTMFTKVASSSPEDEHLRSKLRNAAVTTFRLADYEECTFVHRCKVYEAGLVDVIAKRVIFFTRHIIFCTSGSKEKIPRGARIFKVTELEDAFVNYPEVQSLTIVIADREYEVQCGTASAAKNLLEKFEALLHNEFFEFERSLLQDAERLSYLTPFLNVAPKLHYNCNDVLLEAGLHDQGVWHVVKGSLQVMDGKRRVAILEPGSLVGDMEYLTSSRMGFTVSVRSSEGADVHRLPRPLLDGLLGKREVALPFYVGMAGLFAGKIFAQLIVDKPSAYVSPEKERMLKLKSQSKETRIFKLLKLRKSDFLRMLDNDSLKLLARGSRTRVLRRGQVLLKQGDKIKEGYNDVMYVVLSGTLRALLNNGLGMMEVEQMSTGNVIGEQGVLLDKPRGATVESVTDAELAEVKKSQVEAVLKNNPKLREALDATMQTRMARAPNIPARAEGGGNSFLSRRTSVDMSESGSQHSGDASAEPIQSEEAEPTQSEEEVESSMERELTVTAPPTTPHIPDTQWGIEDLEDQPGLAASYLTPPPAPPLPLRRRSLSHVDPLIAASGYNNTTQPHQIPRQDPEIPEHQAHAVSTWSVADYPNASAGVAVSEGVGVVYGAPTSNLVFSPHTSSSRVPSSSRAHRLVELGRQMGIQPSPPSPSEHVVRARKTLLQMQKAQSR